MSTLAIVILVLLAPFWLPLAIFMIVFSYLFLLWLIGFPITVTVKKQKIGYIRWFWFHRY
jgi:hypothetical protein